MATTPERSEAKAAATDSSPFPPSPHLEPESSKRTSSISSCSLFLNDSPHSACSAPSPPLFIGWLYDDEPEISRWSDDEDN